MKTIDCHKTANINLHYPLKEIPKMTSPMINKAYRSTIAVNAGVMTPPNPKCCTNASVLCRDCYAAAQGMVL
ncbi:MAG: hypothetical protein WD065_19370, partial [Planctomycetaceae bacterium]